MTDAEEEKKKEEMLKIAKKELEDWYKTHEETIAKTKAANRYSYILPTYYKFTYLLLVMLHDNQTNQQFSMGHTPLPILGQ